MSTMATEFGEWLLKQLEEKDWTQTQLAKRARTTRQVIHNYINNPRDNPDKDILKSIAHAFGLSDETVFRAAGVLDPIPVPAEDFTEWLHVLKQLPQRDREELLALARYKLEHQEQPAKRKREGASSLEFIN